MFFYEPIGSSDFFLDSDGLVFDVLFFMILLPLLTAQFYINK